MQSVPDPETEIFTGGFTNTVTESIPWQEFASVTFTVYVVVTDGNAFVLAAFGVCKVAAGVHEYVAPPEVLIITVSPEQIVTSLPAKMVRLFATVTTIVSFITQPAGFVPVTTYVVVATGFATGFGMFVALSPADGDQE
jgi:hypothetical protein